MKPRENRSPPLPSLPELIAMLEQSGLGTSSPEVQRLLAAWATSRSPENDPLILNIWRYLQPRLLMAEMAGLNTFPRPPDANHPIGTVGLGYAEPHGIPIGLFPDELTLGLASTGSTGAGKSTLARLVARTLPAGIPCWVMSFNLEYRGLAPEYTIIPLRKLRFNPLQAPPGVDLAIWCSDVSTLLSQCLGLLGASRAMIQRAITKLYAIYNPRRTGIWPSLHDLYEFLKGIKVHPASREAGYRTATLNRLGAVLSTNGTLYRCSCGHDPRKLARSRIVLEVQGMTPEAEALLLMASLWWQFRHFLMSAALERGLRLLVIVDEAQRLFDRHLERRSEEGVPLPSQLIAQVRKVGLAMMIAAQSPSLLLSTVRQNTATKVMFRQEDGQDVRAIAESLRLTPEQADMLVRLEKGQAVVRIPSHPEPFLLRVPFFEADRYPPSMGQGAIERRAETFLGHVGFAERVPLKRFRPVDTPGSSQPQNKKTNDRPNERPSDLDRQARQVLQSIVNCPLWATAERYSTLGLSASTGSRIQKSLLKAGLVHEVKISTVGRGAPRKLLEPTEKGLAELGLRLDQYPGQGGFLHRFFQARLRRGLRAQGHRAEIEYVLRGKRADVGYETPEGPVALEVEFSPQHGAENVQADLQAGFRRVEVYVATTAIERRIARECRRLGLEKALYSFHRLSTVK